VKRITPESKPNHPLRQGCRQTRDSYQDMALAISEVCSNTRLQPLPILKVGDHAFASHLGATELLKQHVAIRKRQLVSNLGLAESHGCNTKMTQVVILPTKSDRNDVPSPTLFRHNGYGRLLNH
jgi:hypothetical protein